jgi:hypothetical protein
MFAGPLSLAIALALDDDLVGVVSESIDSALGEEGILEEWDPFVDGAIARENRGGAPMAFEDHLVEVRRLLGVETAQPKVIDDEDIGSEQAAEGLVGGVIGAGLVELLQEVIGAQEEHLAAGAARGVPERAGEKRLPDADRSEEDHVLLPVDEAEREKIADAITVEGDRGVPVEAFQGVLLVEAGAAEALSEIFLIAPIDLVLEQELEEVELAELGFASIGDAVGNRWEKARELQALEDGLERLRDFNGAHDCSSLRAW